MEREGKSSTFMSNSLSTNGNTAKVPAIKSDSKHFTSLQIFTSYAEPALDEYITQKEQTDLENKHREEEDKLYRYARKLLLQRWMYIRNNHKIVLQYILLNIIQKIPRT